MKKYTCLLGIAITIPLLANCANNPKITIKNKVDMIGYVSHTYQLEVEAKNLGSANLIYTSSVTDVATIDNTGLITFVNKGVTTIKVASSLDENINDSFDLDIATTYVEGIVTDENGAAIDKVHVSYGNVSSVDTDLNGYYAVPVDDIGQVLYFEKLGYLTKQYVPTLEEIYDLHDLNIALETGDLKVVTVKGTVKDINGNPATNVDLSIKKSYNAEYFLTISDDNGNFEFKDIIVGQTVVIETFNNKFNHSLVVVDTSSTQDVDITLEPYQEEMMFSKGEKDITTGNDKMILGHVYRRDLENQDNVNDTLVFNFEANYPAFVESNEYRICIDAGTDPASPLHKATTHVEDSNDFDIAFTSSGIIGVEHYGGSFGEGEAKVEYLSDYRLNVKIPYKYAHAIGLDENETPIGVYFDSSLVSKTNRCAIYGHTMTEENQLSYIRLNKDNEAYAGSDNVKPDPIFKPLSGDDYLNWETTPSNEWRFATYNGSTIIGQVGNNYNYGYQFKVAKRGASGEIDDNGIYILAKMRMSEMNGYFLEDSWKPNIYIDSNVSGTTYDKSVIDADINRYAMISNYTIERSFPKNKDTPFNNTVPYLNDKVYGLGVRYYTNRDLAIIFIPYEAIQQADETTTLGKTSNFGLALNLNYKTSEWYAFQGNNPTGYVADTTLGDYDNTSIPHFENRLSYIHFNGSDLSTINFARPS